MTDSNITAVVRAIQDLTSSITGIAHAPDMPIESPSVFPFVVCYPENGDFKGAPAGTMTGLHNIIVELHINRKELPIDVEKIQTYLEAIPKKILASYNLSGTCQTMGNITYSIRFVNWANMDTLAVVYTIRDVKIQEALT